MNYQDIVFENISGRKEKRIKQKSNIKVEEENIDDFLKSFDAFIAKKKSGGDYEIIEMSELPPEDTVVIPQPKQYEAASEEVDFDMVEISEPKEKKTKKKAYTNLQNILNSLKK